MKKKILKILHWIFGHPIQGNMYIVGMDTYCTCGRMNRP